MGESEIEIALLRQEMNSLSKSIDKMTEKMESMEKTVTIVDLNNREFPKLAKKVHGHEERLDEQDHEIEAVAKRIDLYMAWMKGVTGVIFGFGTLGMWLYEKVNIRFD